MKLLLFSIVTLAVVRADYSNDLESLLTGTYLPDDNSAGPAWFNITGTLPDYITPAGLESYGVHSYTSYDRLVGISNIAAEAFSAGNWGDYLYLYNAFSYGGSAANTYLDNGAEIYDDLVSNVYSIGEDQVSKLVSSSTSQTLADIYSNMDLSELPAQAPAVAIKKRSSWTGIYCSTSNVPNYYDCQDLVETTLDETNVISGGPRNLNYFSCYISWSQDAVFEEEDLYNAAYTTNQDCVINNNSGYITGVDLAEYDGIQQCLSNRATGCG
jgi:hypothetical protein